LIIGLEARGRSEHHAVTGDNRERSAVHVHRMNEIVVRPDKSEFHGLAYAHVQGIRSRKRFAVDREIVRERSFHEHGRIGQTIAIEPFLELNDVFHIRRRLGRAIARADDDRAPRELLYAT